MVEQKGISTGYPVKSLVMYVRSLGMQAGFIQCDPENSALAVARKACDELQGVKRSRVKHAR
eukprot:1651485-Amphidinium_carterae.1